MVPYLDHSTNILICKLFFLCVWSLFCTCFVVLRVIFTWVKVFQDYSRIQDFKAVFPQKVSLKMLN